MSRRIPVTAFALLFVTACGLNNVPLSHAELDWKSDSWSCSGNGCCIKGDSRGRCVLAEDVTVLLPDGTGTQNVRYIQVDGGKRWGLASRGGDTIIEPVAGTVIALNSRALLDRQGNLHTPDGVKKLGMAVFSVKLDSGLFVHFAVVRRADVGADLAPVLPNGKLGKTISNASVLNYPVGQLAVVSSAQSATGPRGSLLVDVAGEVVWTGGEVRVYGVPKNANASGIGPSSNVALVRVGTAPFMLDGRELGLFHPLGPDGLPVRMPDSVVGVVPYASRAPRYLRSDVAGRPDEVFGWVVVVRHGTTHEYRLGGGEEVTPTELFANLSKMVPIDEVRFVIPSHSGNRLVDGVGVGHRKNEGDWVALAGRYADSHTGTWLDRTIAITSGADVPGRGGTPEEAAFNAVEDVLAREAKFAKESEEEARRREAEAKTRALARAAEERAFAERTQLWAKEFFTANAAACPANVSVCRRVEEAAVYFGDPAAVKWLQDNRSYGASMNEPCRTQRASSSGCSAFRAKQATMEVEAARRAEEQRKWEGQLGQASGVTPWSSTVSVHVYEGGRLQVREMTDERYRQVYGR